MAPKLEQKIEQRAITTILSALESVTAEDLADVDAKIAEKERELAEEIKRREGEISGLRTLQRMIDRRLNGPKQRAKRGSRKASSRQAASDDDSSLRPAPAADRFTYTPTSKRDNGQPTAIAGAAELPDDLAVQEVVSSLKRALRKYGKLEVGPLSAKLLQMHECDLTPAQVQTVLLRHATQFRDVGGEWMVR